MTPGQRPTRAGDARSGEELEPTRAPAAILDALAFAGHGLYHELVRHEFTGSPAEWSLPDPCPDHPAGRCLAVVWHCHTCGVAAAFHQGGAWPS